MAGSGRSDTAAPGAPARSAIAVVHRRTAVDDALAAALCVEQRNSVAAVAGGGTGKLKCGADYDVSAKLLPVVA